MCGRFFLTSPLAAIAELFGADANALPRVGALSRPRYNVAPGQDIIIVREGAKHGRELASARWGLIPHWVREPDMGLRTINARAETADALPSFRQAMRRTRCLIPADGFYEWKSTPAGKVPMAFAAPPPDAGIKPPVLALAGLYDRWDPPEDDLHAPGPVESCTILTTEASPSVRGVHHRMPLILPAEAWDLWLSHEVTDPEVLRPWLSPWSGDLVSRQVSRALNSPKADFAGLWKPDPGEGGGASGRETSPQ